MSADNWTTCPRCKKRNAEIWERWRKEAGEAYGKVPPADYERKRKAAETGPDWDRDSFREDYELGVIADSDEFYISYGGSCSVCNFSHSFKHEEKLKL